MSGPAVLEELWTSFTAVLRSYLAAASLGHPEPPTIVTTAKEVLVQSMPGRLLRLTIETEEGAAGQWCLVSRASESARGKFTLLLNGTIEWSGTPEPFEPLEMDALAILLAQQVFCREEDVWRNAR